MDEEEHQGPDKEQRGPDAPPAGATRRGFIMGGIVAVAALAAGGVVVLAARVRGLARGLPRLRLQLPGYVGAFKINTVEFGTPAFDEAAWTMQVDGLVEAPLRLGWREFLDLPHTLMTKDFVCVEGWSVPGVRWEGIKVAEIVRRARPSSAARYVVFHADGGVYTDTMSLDQARDDRALLAFRANGAALDPRQGRPVRLVVPWMYGYKSVKWVRRLEFVSRLEPGYWERRGYPADADLPS